MANDTSELFDAVVVGAGQAGPSLAARLAQAGQRVALVERRRLGGTCVNDGCIPTKTLVASARAAWMARSAAAYGVTIAGAIDVDMPRVKARKDAVVQASRDSLQAWLGGTPNLTLIEGHARFVGPRRLAVADRVLEARRVFVNVGARPFVPDVEGLRAGPHLTSTSIMELDFVPPHLIVLGGSYIGLEFAQMYRRFGSAVTVIERAPRLIPREDPDVSAEVKRFLEIEGIRFVLDAEVSRVSHRESTVTVTSSRGEAVGTHVLVAVGRTPNTDDLGVEAAGIRLDPGGRIVVNERLETSAPDVFAIGECNGRGAFTHTAYNDYEIVAANLLDGEDRSVLDRIAIYGLFVDPPLGRVGMNEAEARASGRRVLLGLRPMARVGRARERGETHGFIKVMVDADTKEILGAAILGIEGDEAIHGLADVMYAKAPYTTISRAVHVHPTVSELIPTALQTLAPLGPA